MGIEYMQAIPIDNAIHMHAVPGCFDYSVKIRFIGAGWAGLHVGMDNQGRGGYALIANVQTQTLHFMQRHNGAVLLDRGMKRLALAEGVWYPLRITYDGKVLRLWFDENPLDDDSWPKFEFPIDLPGRMVGMDAGRNAAEFAEEQTLAYAPQPDSAATFTNPVTIGADPDILYHEGKYYLYNRIPNDPGSPEDAHLFESTNEKKLDEVGDINAIFRVSCSEDLVHWSACTPVFYRTDILRDAFCMSPNVFYKDGYFYLLFAAGRMQGEESFHIHYAVATSPMGPFEMKTLAPLHKDIEEIGGMPFVDADGQCYITYVRFDRGNHIYLQRLTVAGGIITPEDDTLVHVLSPHEPYEVDRYGRIVEGGVIIPHKGMYYMIYACGHYLGHYGEAYAVADNIYGPYNRYEHNPILHHHFQADGTGDGIVVYNADRTEMYMGYHRHTTTQDVEPRMTCLDPMKFVPNPQGGPDILVVRGPSTVPQPIPFKKQ